MPRSRPRLSAVVTAVAWGGSLLGLVACRQAEPLRVHLSLPDGVDAVDIPATRVSGHLLVPVRINGREAGAWVVDTGATGNCLIDSVAADHDLASAESFFGGAPTVQGHGALRPVATAWIDSLEIGEARIGRHPAFRLDMDAASLSCGGANGIVGQEFLSRGTISLDFGDSPSLRIHRRGTFMPPPDAVAIPMQVKQHLLHVMGTLGDGRAVDFVIDTGDAGTLTLAPSLAEQLAIGDGVRTNTVLHGQLDTRIGTLASLTVLGRTYRDQEVVILAEATAPVFEGAEGFIGTGLLRGLELTFDTDAQELWVRESPRSTEPPPG